MSAAFSPKISILIPAFNGAAWIAETLDRVPDAAGGVPYETVVVDNASRDETVAICRGKSGVRVLLNEENAGFSRAVNRAARAATGETLVVINQDLHLEPDSLKIMAQFLSSNRAVAGGALTYPNGSEQPSCGPFPTLFGTVWRLALPRRIRKYDLSASRPKEDRPVDWVTGAFVGFTRELFDLTGGFGEDYFMYYEDVDFCRRAAQAGFPSYFLPQAKAIHVAPFSDRGDAPDWLRREVRRSQMTYFRKHRPGWESGTIRALNRAYFAAKGWPWP